MIILYSTGCPQCKVLKTKLDSLNINYELITDESIMMEKGFRSAPILEVDGEIMTFTQAIKWTKEVQTNGN